MSCLEEDGDTDEENDGRLQFVIRGRKPTPHTQGSRSTSMTPSPSPGRESDLDMDLAKSDSDIDWSASRSHYQLQVELSRAKPTGAGCSWVTDWASRWEIARNLSQVK